MDSEIITITEEKLDKTPEKKTTLPFMTPLERARIIGTRASQLENNAITMFSPEELKELKRKFGHIDPVKLATLELEAAIGSGEKNITFPLMIIRNLPSGISEQWRIQDFTA